MGMYDSVNIRCPTCRSLVEFQSKAGECTLDTFSEYSVPPEVALSICGNKEECFGCGEVLTVYLDPPPKYVQVYGIT